MSNQALVDFEAYKVTGGLWCITAIIPFISSAGQSSTAQPLSSPLIEPKRLQLKVLMISPEFSTSLPVLLPGGQNPNSVDTSITLPAEAKFISLDIRNDGQSATQTTKLTLLPLSLTGGAVRAKAKLISESGAAWDLSTVRFSYVKPVQVLLYWLLLPFGILAVYWLASGALTKKEADTSSLRNHSINKILELYDEIYRRYFYDQSMEFKHERFKEEFEHEMFKEMTKVKRKILDLLDQTRLKLSRKIDTGNLRDEVIELSEHFARLTDRFLYDVSETNPQTANDREKWAENQLGFIQSVRLLVHQLRLFNPLSAQIRRQQRRRFLYSRILRFSLAALIVLALALFYTLVAQGQASRQASSKEPENVAALSGLGMTVKRKEPQSDKVDVRLDFIVLTNATAKEVTEEISIGTGDTSEAEMEDVNVHPNDRAKIAQHSQKQTRFVVPAINNPSVSILKKLNDSGINIERVWLSDKLQTDLNNKSNVVNVEYVVTKAQTTEQRTLSGWLHWFPFDAKSLEVPIEMRQLAMVSKIELPRESDFDGHVFAEGINASFIETEHTYQLDQGKQQSRITVPAGERVTLKAKLRRTRLQQFFLTIGQLILAGFAGYFLGVLANLQPNNTMGTIIEGIGIISIPYVVRSSVFSTYKDLPSLLSGQSPTIFELFFILSLAIFIFFAVRTRKRKRKT